MTTEISGSGSGRKLPEENALSVRLGPRNLRKFGFAAFHKAGEPVLQQGIWHRPVRLEVGGAGAEARIAVPEKYLHPLEAPGRLSEQPGFCIGTAERGLSSLALLSARAGWNQTPADLRGFFGGRYGQAFTAKFQTGGGAIDLGSGSLFIPSGRLAWIGMILVHEELRRQGIARAMMRHCLQVAEWEMDIPCIGLDATPAGRELYLDLGFMEAYPIWRCRIDTSDTPDILLNEAVSNTPDYRGIRGYLDRTEWLGRLPDPQLLRPLPGSSICALRRKGEVTGFAMSRPGRIMPYIGPVLADSSTEASLLIAAHLQYWKSRGFTQVIIDIPELHCGAGDDTTAHGPQPIPAYFASLQRLRPLIRMYRAGRKSVISTRDIVDEELGARRSVLYAIAGPEIG